MKSDDTAIIVHTPKGVGNFHHSNFCHDELANLKERYTDEQLQKMWEEAYPKPSKISGKVIITGIPK